MSPKVETTKPSQQDEVEGMENWNLDQSCPGRVQGQNDDDNGERPPADIYLEQLLEFQTHSRLNQERTLKALQDLSKTITTLMMAQMKRDKEDGDDTKELLNVDRATVRLDGLEVYAVVSALTVATAIACFDVYGADFANIFAIDHIDRTNILPLLFNTIFLVVSGVGIIAGLHATLVFSLMTMYGRTAVGVSHDEAFVEFFVQTGRVRYRGFHTFKLSLYCFLVQVLFTITSKCAPILRPVIVLINLAAMWMVYSDTQSVIEKASEILFNFKGGTEKRLSVPGSLSLQRTLSDVGGNIDGNTRGGGGGGLLAMQKQSKAQSTTTDGRHSRQKNVARSNSGILVYDVKPRNARPARRAGRRPSKEI